MLLMFVLMGFEQFPNVRISKVDLSNPDGNAHHSFGATNEDQDTYHLQLLDFGCIDWECIDMLLIPSGFVHLCANTDFYEDRKSVVEVRIV